MKFTYLEINNFRAIETAIFDTLDDTVIVSGQNGVGKSCIFDAIRLLKTSYGGYDKNEMHNWFNEFQIKNIDNKVNLDKILRDKSKPISIKASIKLSASEVEYLKTNGEKLIEKLILNPSSSTTIDIPHLTNTPSSLAQNSREYSEEIKHDISEKLKDYYKQLEVDVFEAYIEISNEKIYISDNLVLEVLFNTFEPENLGIIDYHGAHRNYQNENISNLNVNFQNPNDLYKGHLLYNYTNKYNNVKTEMASSYVKALISRESGEEENAIDTLNQTLKYLFDQFFPGKEFTGIKPSKNGTIEFPVKLSTGEIHDIGELSSGEKEVLFGYLRLRNQSPKNSVILIDEPELHLNPKLAKKLPEFYHKSIGKELNNQIWLVSHSESILKEAIDKTGFSVYYMSESLNNKNNQLKRLSANKDLESAVIDLVGDFSNYQSGNKIVIFEGLNSEFDKTTTNTLFPEFEKNINSISAGGKTNVKNVQKILRLASDEGIINKTFYSIIDRDSNEIIDEIETKEFSWDVYHIENYLLVEKYILLTLSDLHLTTCLIDNEEKIKNILKEIASETRNSHIKDQLHEFVANKISHCKTMQINKDLPYNEAYHLAALNSMKKLNDEIGSSLSKEMLTNEQTNIEKRLEESLLTDDWRKEYKGRVILNNFICKHAQGIKYPLFRNLIITNMKKDNFRPKGMESVIMKILNDK